MKLIGLPILALMIALTCVGSLAAEQPDDAVKSKIVALEKAWNQAYKFRDKKALADILHDPMILIDDDGSLQSRSVFLAGVDNASPSDQQQAEPESIAVYVFGDVAVATGVYRSAGIEKGKAFVKRNRFVDTWIKKGDNWVCIAASATPITR